MGVLLVVTLVAMFSGPAWSNDYCDRDADGSCKVKQGECGNDDEPCFLEEEEPADKYGRKKNYPHWDHLSMLDGVKVGHVQEHIIDGKVMKMITRSLRPLLFEIPDGITDDEIEHIQAVASNQYRSGGMHMSKAKGGLTPEDPFKPSNYVGRAEGPAQYFHNWDTNQDEVIDLNEAALFARNFNFLYFNESDVLEMIEKVNLPQFRDGQCTKGEFSVMNTFGIENYLNILLREHPRWRQRFSEQTWLPLNEMFDPVLSKFRERFGKLLKVPLKILEGSEHLQVAKYTPGGHYHAHHDSETEKETSKRCCHHTSTKEVLGYNTCRLCRFITAMGYLEAPEEGGETAFPAADNITYADAAFRTRGKKAKDLFNLSEHCYDANLVVKPKKGTMVVWYNHQVDPQTGWLGKLDEWSIHGGCDVKKGEKWISNLWLTAPYADGVDRVSMYHMDYLETTMEAET